MNANLKNNFDSFDVISSVGDPFQAFALGLLIGARLADQTVILSGGSQMVAIVLLALHSLNFKNKDFTREILIATILLVNDNSLGDLLELINKKFNVNIIGLASPLNFNLSKYKELKDYELGHVMRESVLVNINPCISRLQQ